MSAVEHAGSCAWPDGPPCTRFSTDGTLAGALIAHTMNTADEDEIAEIGRADLRDPNLTGMPEEQAEWEGLDLRAFPGSGPGLFGSRTGERRRP